MSTNKDSSSAVPSAKVAASMNCTLKRVTTMDDFDESEPGMKDEHKFTQLINDSLISGAQTSLSSAAASSLMFNAVPNPDPISHPSAMQSIFDQSSALLSIPSFHPSIPPLSQDQSQYPSLIPGVSANPSAFNHGSSEQLAYSHSDDVGYSADGGIFHSGDLFNPRMSISNNWNMSMMGVPPIDPFPHPQPMIALIPPIKTEIPAGLLPTVDQPSFKEECIIEAKLMDDPSQTQEDFEGEDWDGEWQSEYQSGYQQQSSLFQNTAPQITIELRELQYYSKSEELLKQQCDPFADPGLVEIGGEISQKQLQNRIKQLLRSYIWEILHGEAPEIQHVVRNRRHLRIYDGSARLDAKAVRYKAFRLRHSVLHRKVLHVLLHLCENTKLAKNNVRFGETLRHVFYQVRTEHALFDHQTKSDRTILDLCSMLRVNRGMFGLRAEPRGLVCGALVDLSKLNGHENSSHWRNEFEMGPMPINEALVQLARDNAIRPTSLALGMLIIEKDAILNELVRNDLIMSRFILISGKGYPDLNTRMFVSHLYQMGCNSRLPCFSMVDFDPHGLDIHLIFECGSVQSTESPNYALSRRIQNIGLGFSDIVDLCRLVAKHNDVRQRDVRCSQKQGYPKIKGDSLMKRDPIMDINMNKDAIIKEDEQCIYDSSSSSEDHSSAEEETSDESEVSSSSEEGDPQMAVELNSIDNSSLNMVDECSKLKETSKKDLESIKCSNQCDGLIISSESQTMIEIDMPIPEEVSMVDSHAMFLQSLGKGDREKMTSLRLFDQVTQHGPFKDAIRRWTLAKDSQNVKANIEAIKMILNLYRNGPCSQYARDSPYSFYIWWKVLPILRECDAISQHCALPSQFPMTWDIQPEQHQPRCHVSTLKSEEDSTDMDVRVKVEQN